jgi:hypothetical protein
VKLKEICISNSIGILESSGRYSNLIILGLSSDFSGSAIGGVSAAAGASVHASCGAEETAVWEDDAAAAGAVVDRANIADGLDAPVAAPNHGHLVLLVDPEVPFVVLPLFFYWIMACDALLSLAHLAVLQDVVEHEAVGDFRFMA